MAKLFLARVPRPFSKERQMALGKLDFHTKIKLFSPYTKSNLKWVKT
jgi:hypothetical protein